MRAVCSSHRVYSRSEARGRRDSTEKQFVNKRRADTTYTPEEKLAKRGGDASWRRPRCVSSNLRWRCLAVAAYLVKEHLCGVRVVSGRTP